MPSGLSVSKAFLCLMYTACAVLGTVLGIREIKVRGDIPDTQCVFSTDILKNNMGTLESERRIQGERVRMSLRGVEVMGRMSSQQSQGVGCDLEFLVAGECHR